MQKKRLWAVAGTVFAILLLALLVIPSFIDWSKYQSVARDRVRTATGYDLTIGGKLSMALLPTPHATVTDVTVTKPVTEKTEPFLKFEQADVRIALLPLLLGRVEVASVTLEKPVVTLIKFQEGVDNYTPVKGAAQAPGQTEGGEPAAAEVTTAEGDTIAINKFHIKDGRITMNDVTAGTTREIGIEEMTVKADTLTGPFDGEGKITLGEAGFKIDMSTGGYKQGETLPVQLNVEENDGRMKLKWSGVVDTRGSEYQGELALAINDLADLLEDAGMAMAVPNISNAELSGMVTANPTTLSLTNGTMKLGKTKFKSRLDVRDIGKPAMKIAGEFITDDYLDVDALMEIGEEVAAKQQAAGKKEEKKEPAKAPAKGTVAPLLPEGFKLPSEFTADVRLEAPGIEYRKERSGTLGLRFQAANGEGSGNVSIADLPGGGDITLTADIGQEGGLSGTILGSLSSLKETLSKWLDVVDAETLDQPGMPKRIDLQGNYKVEGYNATADITTLSLGETKLNGTVGYTAATRPVLTAKLKGNVFTLPSSKPAKTDAGKEGEDAKAPEEAKSEGFDFDFDPPQLPFDVKFDLALDRLVKDDLTLMNVAVAGTYDSKGVVLTRGQASVNGGTLNVTGTVADLKALSGIDAQAALRTDDLETFVAAMTGKPLAFKQKIGQFAGSVKAKGDRKKMNADVTAAARGYTLSASGTLDDPFNPELPGTMTVRIRHGNLTDAIRVFSPAFNNSGRSGAPQPVDLSGTAKIAGNVYEFDSMKGTLGSSDIAGSLKADLSGKAPAVTANLSSTRMDLGSLLGVADKSSKVGGKGTTSTASANVPPPSVAGNWSREQLDLDFMKSINLDIDLAAKTLVYGTWTLTDAKAGIDLKDGVLKVSPLTGGLYGGKLDANLNAAVGGTPALQVLNVEGKADVTKVAVGPFLQALMSSSTKRADGIGSVSVNIKTSGSSAGQLMNALSGEAAVDAQSLLIYGMDIDKLAANIVEAFDGGWKGVLAGVTTQGLASGQTKFKDFKHTFPIANGDMAVKAFKLETTNANAILDTNGVVSFGRYVMDVRTDVLVTQPKDVPVINLRISGPLNSPSKSVNSTALDNLIRSKLGDKVQDVIQDKLGDSPLGNALGQFLGGTPKPQPAPTPVPAPATQSAPTQMAPVTEETPAQQPSTEPAPAAEPQAAAPEQAPVQEEKPPEQQLLEGVLNKLAE